MKKIILYPKLYRDLVKQNNLYILRLYDPSSLILDKLVKNGVVDDYKLYASINDYYVTKPTLKDIEDYSSYVNHNLLIVKPSKDLNYFEEIITGEKIPIWFFKINFKPFSSSSRVYEIITYYSNIMANLQEIPPYFIPIFYIEKSYKFLKNGQFRIIDDCGLYINFHNNIVSDSEHEKLRYYMLYKDHGYKLTDCIIDNCEYNELKHAIDIYSDHLKKGLFSSDDTRENLEFYKNKLEKYKNIASDFALKEEKKKILLNNIRNGNIL